MDCKLRAKNCGGCPLLGLDYAAQLKQKEAAVKKLLGKYGPVNPIRGMENPYHYRNKVISTFTTGWGGKLTSGIYAANSHKVLPVESCLLQDEVLDKTMQAVRAAAIACRYQPYDEDKGTGLVRHCLLRRGVCHRAGDGGAGDGSAGAARCQELRPGPAGRSREAGRDRDHRGAEREPPQDQRRAG